MGYTNLNIQDPFVRLSFTDRGHPWDTLTSIHQIIFVRLSFTDRGHPWDTLTSIHEILLFVSLLQIEATHGIH
jgi:hypothetical protein